jgi:DNA polymerase III sliding clamp (beta) subunit (PCNA family)
MVMRISLDAEMTGFTFNITGKELDSAISRVAAVIASSGSNVKNFILLGIKGKVVLLAFNPDTFVYVVLDGGSSDGSGSFGFTSTTMQGVIKGRADLDFTFTGSECEFKLSKGRYSGKFVTLPITTDQVALINNTFNGKKSKADAQGSVLPRHVLDSLKAGISMTAIKDVYTEQSLLSYMSLSDKGILSVSAFDNHHFGLYKAKVQADGVTFRAALPSSHFLIIDRMVEGEEAKFYIRDENIKVEGDNFMLILPSTQTEDKNYALIASYIKDLDAPQFSCEYDNEKLMSLTDNLFTLHAVNTSFELSHKEGGTSLGVSFTTSNGTASDSLKVVPSSSKTIKARVDPRVLKDMLPLLKGQSNAVLSIVVDKVIRIDCGNKDAKVTLVGALAS